MSKDKLPDNKELKEPHFKGLPNDKNSFGSKDKSMIPNADSKENDKGSSCNSLVKPAVSSPLGIDGHNCSVHGSKHEGKTQASALFTDSTSATGITVSDSVGDETFYSTCDDTESLDDSCGRSVTDSTNYDSTDGSDIDNGKEEKLDTDVNESSFFEKDLHNQIHKESTVKDLENKEKSCKVFKEKKQGNDDLNEKEIVSKSSDGSFKSKNKGAKKCRDNSPDNFPVRLQGRIGNDVDGNYTKTSDAHVEETIVDCGSPIDSGLVPFKGTDQNSSSDELKEEEFDKGMDQIISGKKLFEEDLGTLPEGSDSSDEDLLTPPRFLYEKTKLKPDICTPEKGVAPVYSTPSPISRGEGEEKTIKYKLSFEKLIADKVKHRERNAELAKMEEELQQGINNGGIGQLPIPSTFSDIESEEDLTDGKFSFSGSLGERH